MESTTTQGISDKEGMRLFLQQPVPTFIININPMVRGLRDLNSPNPQQLDEYLQHHSHLITELIASVKVVAVNPAALEITELEDEQAFADYYPQLFTEESVRMLRPVLLQMAEGDEEYAGEITIRTCGGRMINAQFFMRPLNTGDLSRVICNFIEITHWKRAEEALEREQETLKGSPVFSFRWRNAPGWPVESVSPNIIQLGYASDDLLSGRTPFSAMVHPDDLQRVADEVVQYSAAGQTGFEQDYRVFTVSGELRWIYDYTSIVRDPNGEVTHYDGILLDITSRKQAEQALRASEQRYQEMFESNPVSIWLEDITRVIPRYDELRQQGVSDFRDHFQRHPELIFEMAGLTRVLDINAATLEMFEAESKEQLLGSLDKVFCAESLAGSIEVHVALADGQRVFEVETVNQTLNGNRLNILIKMNMPTKPDYSNVLVTLVDITARKQVEEKLAASKRELGTILNNMQDTYYRTDHEGRLVWVSQSVELLLGYTIDEILGMPLYELYARPQEREELLQNLQAQNGRVKNYKSVLHHRDGHLVYVSTNAQYYFDDDGNLLGVEGTTRDMTQQVLAEQALSASEKALAQANRIARLGHFEWNIDTDTLLWSPEVYEILGIDDTSLVPNRELFLSLIDEDDREHVVFAITKTERGADTYSMRYGIRDLHGVEKYLESKGEVSSVDGVRCMIGYVRDITVERRAEEDLRHARDMAEQANRLKGDFLANMSHEIRTPMNGVVGFVNLLSRTNLDNEQNDYVETMKTSMGDLLAIVNDILDFSRIESNKLSIHTVEFDLLEAVSDVVSLFSATANARGLTLKMNVAEDVPYTVAGDPVRLRQVLSNLVSNAIKFTAQGGIWLKVFVESRHDNDFVLCFEVEDTGVGIDEADIEKLFDAFTQLETGQSGGTGLGLAISRRLLELMGGDISLSQRDGGGSIFSFTLPLKRLHQEALAYPLNRAVVLDNYSGKRVLVVDDNAINRKLISTLLGQLGVETVEAVNGQDALSCHHGDCFDLIMMDIRMPIMDGVEATKQIRIGEERHQRTPIIALTAHALPHEREIFILAGMDDCLTKPIREEDLFILLQRYLNNA